MAETTRVPPAPAWPPSRRRKNLLLPTFTLALWRLRQTWRMLLLTGLGTIAAVMLVCAVPLFSEIALSAGLRGALSSDPRASHLIVQTNNDLTSATLVQQEQQQIDQLVRQGMGSYITQSPTFSINLSDLIISPAGSSSSTSTGSGQAGPNSQHFLQIVGVDSGALLQHVTLLSGETPRDNPHALEIMLTQSMASSLNAPVGSVITANLPIFGSSNGPPPTISLLVTGIYAVKQSSDPVFTSSPFFGPDSVRLGLSSGVVSEPSGPPGAVTAVASNQAMLAAVSRIPNTVNAGPNNVFPGPPAFNWYYTIDLSHVTINSVGDLSQRLSTLQNNLNGLPGYAPDQPPTTLLNDLTEFTVQIIVAQVPVTLLLVQVFGLILIFISLMINLLVERQGDAIAVLRSRGAPRGLIFRSMTLQTICVCLLALVAGPVLAFLLVDFVAGRALGSQQHGALQSVLGQPALAAWGLRWYALAAIICAFFAMVISTYRAANLNILALRRDFARTTRKPFWQRLNLDIIFAVIALVGYSLYSFAVNRVPADVRILLSPLALVAPIFLLLGAAMLFLRFFPSLLSLGVKFASRSRSAAPMLAIVQMARSPRQASRMILLLALSTAFALFTLIFSASQYQRTLDVSAFAVGADFSGQLQFSDSSIADISSRYRSISGVLSATSAYVDDFTENTPTNSLQMHIIAADTSSYGQTIIWPNQGSSVATLASGLSSERSSAIAADDVPAVVDQALASSLQLTSGSHFILQPSGYSGNEEMHFVVLSVVANIPTLYDDPDLQDSGGASGGLLVDYQTYAVVYHLDTRDSAPAPDTIWLRTQGDHASLASVRTALKSGPLAVDQLQDRRAIITQTQNNPLIVDLFGTLDIGAATALLLALLGVLIASWLSARNRLTNFALLRALGGEPRQLARVLLFEQGIIYAVSIGLGVAIGIVLSILVLPVLVIANGIANPSTFNAANLNVPPVHAIYPLPLLVLALGILAAICLISIVVMTSVVARASIGQTLRLNED
ncbi:MAG: FtsX-like permease family protein [Ktedonobacterales bacterium]